MRAAFLGLKKKSMHNKPEFITFTGIDDRTDLARADKLAGMYPIEWGVLFSADNQDARYPCAQAVNEIMQIKGYKAAHLCGKVSKDAAQGQRVDWVPLEQFNRIQLNGKEVPTEYFDKLKSTYGVEIIRQVCEAGFSGHAPAFELYDISGGEGVIPEKIPAHPDGKTFVGYAGGMGPETVISYLKRIDINGPYWIDMESRIRTNGWFDLAKVTKVCELVYGS